MAFNNAGIMLPPVDSANEEASAFDQIVAVNLRGVWASMQHELRQMRDQRSGAIVNCSSLGGLVGGDGRATYHATKHGVIGQTKSVALQSAAPQARRRRTAPATSWCGRDHGNACASWASVLRLCPVSNTLRSHR